MPEDGLLRVMRRTAGPIALIVGVAWATWLVVLSPVEIRVLGTTWSCGSALSVLGDEPTTSSDGAAAVNEVC